MRSVKIFTYIEKLDCFLVDAHYKAIADQLGLTEWNAVVWIGRYFLLDNDNGEHWFDNWERREALTEEAETLGVDSHNILIIDPALFKNNVDGPCHTDAERKKFWTDVLKSLELSLETLFAEARKFNAERSVDDEDYIADLEKRIERIRNQS